MAGEKQSTEPYVRSDDGRVFLRGKTGDLFRTDEAHANELVARGDYDPATADQVHTRTQERNTSVAGSVVRGAGVGLAGGLLAPGKLVSGLGSAALGVEDPLAKLSGRQVVQDLSAIGAHLTGGESEVAAREAREQLEADEAIHPYATAGGELAGNLAGGAPLGRAAIGAGTLAARGLGALGAGARLARAGAGIAGAALEGAGLGANAASEQAWLRNEVATAEQTLAGIGTGALYGGATGGLLAGGGALARRGAAKLSELLGGRAGAAAEGLEGTAARLEAEGAQAAERAGEEGSVLAPKERAETPPMVAAAESSTGSKARKWLSGAGDEAMVDALARGNKGALKDLGGGEAPTAARKREVGALIHELGIGGVGKSEGDMLHTAEQRVSEMGSRLDKVLQAADARVAAEGGQQLAPKSIEALFPKIEALKTKLAGEGMLAEDRAIPAWVEDQTQWLRGRAAAGNLLPSDIQKFRIEVDQRLGKWARAEPGPKAEAARELRRVLEGHLEQEVATTAPDLLADYQRAKKLWSAANWAAETLAERVQVRSGANRMLSPSDYAAGATALLGSGGNPLVAALSAAGNKLIRERGYSTAAVLAKKLAGESVDVAAAPLAAVPTARNVQTLVAHSEERISNGIGRFFGKGGEAAPSRTGRLGTAVALRSENIAQAQKAYQEHAREVQLVASNPELAASRLAGITGPDVAAVAPGLHAQMAQVATRGAQYLASNMPAPATDPDSITPQLDEPPPVSATDLRRYADRVEGVENPLSIVDDLAQGKSSPEKTDAVKAVYPQLFERIRANVFAQLAERTEPVPYHQRLLLDLALDGNGALEPSLKPASLAVMARANEAVIKSAGPPPASGKVPKIAGMFSTRTAQITAPRGA